MADFTASLWQADRHVARRRATHWTESMWMVFDANTYGGAVKRLHEAMLQQGATLEAIEAYRRRGLSDPVVLERLEKICSEAAERVRQAYCDYQGALSGP